MEISIRRGGHPDLATSLRLIERNLAGSVDLPKQLAHPSIYRMSEVHVLLLAESGGLPVGVLYGYAGAAEGPSGHLTLLAVDAEYRRRGMGRALICEYALIAEQAGTGVVWVDVPEGLPEEEQRRLLRYYERLGWTDRTGYLAGLTDHRHEQMYGTPKAILAAAGNGPVGDGG